ncbi:MAG: hypothetical protein O3B13_01190 [Planctomycetota bacterium]|nr:hypothetical protein [Planctomycetota bacterium]
MSNVSGAAARCLVMTVILALGGCSDPAASMRKNIQYPEWDGLTAISSEEVLMPIEMPYERGDMAEFKTAISSEVFAAALDKFEQSEIPADFVTEDRKQAKTAAVENYRKALEAVKSGSSVDDLKSAYEAARSQMKVVGKPIEE